MKPLADRIRPKTLDEFVGQKRLVGQGGFIKKLLDRKGYFPSLVFWGPPGSGKTTLARIIAYHLGASFQEFSGVNAKKSQLEKIFSNKKALSQNKLFKTNPAPTKPTLVFIDEIHRFSKAQQDVLLSPVEQGKIILITATTENPSFSVISPLLSRCQALVLSPLLPQEIETIIKRGLKQLKIKAEPKARKAVVQISNGDARTALNLIEQAGQITPPGQPVTLQTIKNIPSATTLRYDKAGDEHYQTISAFIKSMRASNSSATLYYLGRMIEAGENPLFIARRMIIFASEDVGLADPAALTIANAVFAACQTIGLPEAQINLAHGAAYLAKAPKSRAAYNAYFKALKDVQKHGSLPIPHQLRNAPTKLMKDLGYGKDYEMYPDKNKNLLPEKLKGKKYYSN